MMPLISQQQWEHYFKHMEKKWKTKSGREIPYNELKDDHLVNIVKFCRKRAREGILPPLNSQEEWYLPALSKIKGRKALDIMDYWELKKIAKDRKLI